MALKQNLNYMKKKPYLGIMVIAAFVSAGAFFTINGDPGETWKWVVGIVAGVVAIGSLILAILTPKA